MAAASLDEISDPLGAGRTEAGELPSINSQPPPGITSKSTPPSAPKRTTSAAMRKVSKFRAPQRVPICSPAILGIAAATRAVQGAVDPLLGFLAGKDASLNNPPDARPERFRRKPRKFPGTEGQGRPVVLLIKHK